MCNARVFGDDFRCSSKENHLKCPECQNEIRRQAKKGKNHYRKHGVCMSSETRAFWRKRHEDPYK